MPRWGCVLRRFGTQATLRFVARHMQALVSTMLSSYTQRSGFAEFCDVKLAPVISWYDFKSTPFPTNGLVQPSGLKKMWTKSKKKKSLETLDEKWHYLSQFSICWPIKRLFTFRWKWALRSRPFLVDTPKLPFFSKKSKTGWDHYRKMVTAVPVEPGVGWQRLVANTGV
jgi:hypothetical protein